jgi:hypothetical protein
MRHWFSIFVLVAAIFFLGSLRTRAQTGIELKGNTVLMVRPGSPEHQWLKSHAGQQVRIVVEPAAR